jgi:uncharacterized protein
VDNKLQSAAPSTLPDAVRGRRQLGPDEKFSFGCHPKVACFNHCCADVNIMLTPLDVLKLARRAGLSTTDFLAQHTLKPITKDLHLPVVILRMNNEAGRRCPFVGAQGCTVYEDRPWACRMYPVGMAIPPARAGVDPQPVYFLFEDDYCKGREETGEWTVETWRASQGAIAREQQELGFRDIVSHPWFIGGRQLDPRRIEMFYMAAYDLDAFRRFVLESSFAKRFEVEPELLEALRQDDAALLNFGLRWLRYALFAEPTMTIRKGMEVVKEATAR